MKNKKWILPVCITAGVIILLVVSFFVFMVFMNAKGYGMSVGRALLQGDRGRQCQCRQHGRHHEKPVHCNILRYNPHRAVISLPTQNLDGSQALRILRQCR